MRRMDWLTTSFEFNLFDCTMIIAESACWLQMTCCLSGAKEATTIMMTQACQRTLWRHDMGTLSAFHITGRLCGEPVADGFPSQTPVMWNFDVFFHVDLLNNQSSCQEWVIKFNGLSRTADSEVHIVHISRVIIACTLKSLSPPT